MALKSAVKTELWLNLEELYTFILKFVQEEADASQPFIDSHVIMERVYKI